MASNLPVELEIENQKILRIEIELQEILQKIEHVVETKKSLEHKVLSARATISLLKKTFGVSGVNHYSSGRRDVTFFEISDR